MSNQPLPQGWQAASIGPEPSAYGYRQQLPKSLESKGLALTALMLGIFGFCFSLIPVLWIIAFPLAVVGLVFGLIAVTEANRVRSGKGMAIIGTILCALALVLAGRRVSEMRWRSTPAYVARRLHPGTLAVRWRSHQRHSFPLRRRLQGYCSATHSL